MATSKLTIRTDSATKARFETIATQAGCAHYHDVLSLLIDTFERQERKEVTTEMIYALGLSDEQIQRILAASNARLQDLGAFMREALDDKADRVTRQSNKLEHIEDIATAKSRLAGAGVARVEALVHQLMAENEAAPDINGRWYITQTLVSKKFGVSLVSLKAWFDAHKEAMRAHHLAMGFIDEKDGLSRNMRRTKREHKQEHAAM